jgi:hypothetical protein
MMFYADAVFSFHTPRLTVAGPPRLPKMPIVGTVAVFPDRLEGRTDFSSPVHKVVLSMDWFKGKS